MNLILRTGRRSLSFVETLQATALLAARTAKTSWEERGRHGGLVWRNLLLQIRFTGLDAFALVAVAALALGVIVILQAQTLLAGLSEPGFIERTIVFILIRELPAILVGLILIARSGTAITTELANMRLNREMEALDAHGVPPEVFVVLPRILAFPIASLCLTFYFMLVAVGGGVALLPLLNPSPSSVSFSTIREAIHATDALLPAVKSLTFGLTTSLLCCAYGFSVKRSFREVPRAATRGVAVSFMACMVVNALFSIVAL